MAEASRHWTEVSRSEFPWEREALEFVRERFPDGGAYRAWTNFEFIAGDRSINEVDLLAVTPRGVFLVEIKSWPERIEGDAGTWYRLRDERRERAEDNPILSANKKAKRLKSLLEGAKVPGRKGPLPFIEALVFLSHPEVEPRLDHTGRQGICVRDPDRASRRSSSDGDSPHGAGGLPGIVSTLTRITAEDRQRRRFRPLSTRDADLIARALEAAGVRASRRARRVGDYELGELLEEGPGYQEYAAVHASLAGTERRIRIFTSGSGLEREVVTAAAGREFRALDALNHPGILSPREYVDHELGPALLYNREPDAITLDHYLSLKGSRLAIDQRLELVRQLGETLAYAHARGVIHRALAPRSVLVCDPQSDSPPLRLRDWHAAHREAVTSGHSTARPTGHLEELTPSAASVYLAPESLRSPAGEHLDVFALGAIAFHIFTAQPPASSLVDRQVHLDQHGGLDVGAVIDGAGVVQRSCVLDATAPDVSQRTTNVKGFLADLDAVEEELTEPATEEEIDPTTASKGDALLGYPVVRRLGAGASAVAYLVEDEDEPRVLKVAATPAQNDRIRSEAEVLAKVHDPGVVTLHRADLQAGAHAAILVEFAGDETLAERLRAEGPLELELLERLGEDLLRTVSTLEEQGVTHRDIKPANIGIRRRGRSSELRLTLFDFSLSRTSADAIDAGTPHYLDPFLRLPQRGRFDLHAERFAAAMTLHEMATGQLAHWGDGVSDPASIEDEVTIEPALFDAAVADALAAFFRKALARDVANRFDTAEEMLRAWRDSFAHAAAPQPTTEGHQDVDPDEALARASATTPVAELALSPRARSALERNRIVRVSDLLATSEFALRSLSGVGAGTRGELVAVLGTLRERLGGEEAPDVQGLDLLVRQLVPSRGWEEPDLAILRAFLGLEGRPWATSAQIADDLGSERDSVRFVLDRARERWTKSLPSLSRLRDEISELIASEGAVLPAVMLEDGVLARRGAAARGEERRRFAVAATRAAVEAESRRESPRFDAARLRDGVVMVDPQRADPDAAVSYLSSLAERAAEIAGTEPLAEARATEALSAVDVPTGVPGPSSQRLVRLAAAVAPGVAASDRGELYPVGMAGDIAVRRTGGALASTGDLSLEDVRECVRARYPKAQPPPPRPALDRLLEGFGLHWDDEQAHYRSPRTLASSSVSQTSHRTRDGDEPAERFADRLERSRDRFLALTVRMRRASRAEKALQSVSGVTHIALDAALVDAMQAIASEKHAEWQAVLELDAAPVDHRNWKILLGLAAEAAERLRDRLLATSGTVLASRPGLLARYGQLGMLDEVRRQLTDPTDDHALEGLWLLIPSGGGPPSVEEEPIPVIDENEWAKVPSQWIEARA